jgi:DNA modification methylase
MSVRILNCDVIEGLRQLDDESVHCVVTSPPYWGLRDYGVDGQIGLEPTIQEFLARMVDVFREVRRVLRKDGTCWINMGDSYAAGHGGSTTEGNYIPKVSTRRVSGMRAREDVDVGGWGKTDASLRLVRAGMKPKDLIGQSWRLAFALQEDGWWLRQDIVWAKPNPMPESVTDRCTKAHEYIFLLTKSARYAYDADAIREAALWPEGPNSPESISSPYGQGFTRKARKLSTWEDRKAAGEPLRRGDPGQSGQINRTDSLASKEGRNKRSVWTIATAPFPEAHFATFPPELPEICIKAGCPKGGTVLDPFGGAGTTGLVADRLQRNAVLIELNPEYAAMARRRIDGDRGALLDVMEAAE